MKQQLRAAHRRADFALLGGAFIGLAGTALGLGIYPYTDKADAGAFIAAPKQVAVLPVTPVSARVMPETSCLAEVLYYEARGEGLDGQEAVAEVVLERTRHRNFPATICGVVYEGAQKGRVNCQFSFACNGSEEKPKDHAAWRTANILAEKILSGVVKLSGVTGHAIAFHNIDVTPDWSSTMLKTAQIGNHVFYRFAPPSLLGAAVDANISVSQSVNVSDNAASADVTSEGAADGQSEKVETQVQATSAVGDGA